MAARPGPEQIQRTSGRPTVAPAFATPEAFGADVGRALQSVGTAIGGVAREQQQRVEAELEKQQRLSDANAKLDTRLKIDRALLDAYLEKRNATDFDPKKFDAENRNPVEQILEKLPKDISQEAREAIQREAKATRESYLNQALVFKLGQDKAKAIDLSRQAATKSALAVQRLPDQLPKFIADVRAQQREFAGSSVDPDTLRDLEQDAVEELTQAAVLGWIDVDPQLAIEKLKAGEFDDGLTAPQMARLLAHAEAVQRELDALFKDEVSDAIAVLDRGRMPEGLAELTEDVAGTELEVPLREAGEDSAKVAEFLRKSILEQAAELSRRRDTITRRDLATEDRMRRAHGVLVKQIKDGNGLTVAAELEVIAEVGPVDLSEPETLRLRAVQSRIATAHFGVPLAPLLPGEIDAIELQIDVAPADQVTGLLDTLHEGFGREAAMAFVSQIADKRPELALATVHVAEQPLLAREIVLGGRLLAKNKDVAPAKTERQIAIGNVFGTEDRSVFTPDTATALAPILDAAAALYAARRVATGDFTYDADTFEEALEQVVGGVFSFNGRNILAPVPGMDEDAFEDAMKRLTQGDLVEFGNGVPVFSDGSPFLVDMFEARFFGPEAQLVTAGFDGRYLVEFPGMGFVFDDITGDSYELDMGAFIRSRPNE